MSLNNLRIVLPFAVLLLSGCRRTVVLPEMVDSHYINYQIEYLDERAGNIPTIILPDHMEVYYTRYFIYSSIQGFLNQFSLVHIADIRHKRVSTLLSLFGNKVYCEGKNGELPAAIVEPDQILCDYTGETRVIGGLNSERVQVDTGGEQFSIYVTRDFKAHRPNLSTPYRSIEHPLSEFRIQLSQLKMLLSCAEFEERSIESEIFTIPDDYIPVTRTEMERIINSLFTNE